MNDTLKALRKRMLILSDGELSGIVDGGSPEHGSEAVEAARGELLRRQGLEKATDDSSDEGRSRDIGNECPKCGRVYDKSWRVCLYDDTPLSGAGSVRERKSKKVDPHRVKRATSAAKPSEISLKTSRCKPKVKPPYGINKYVRNAFRVLGLHAGATGTEVARRTNEIKIFSRVGQEPKFPDDVSIFGSIPRDEDSIRLAFHMVDKPRQRIAEELFWFWTDDGRNGTAFRSLVQGDLESAMREWTQGAEGDVVGDDVIRARHNQVILRHQRVLNREWSAAELNEDHWSEWAAVLRDWMSLLSLDIFWEFVSNRLKIVGGHSSQELTTDLRRETLPKIIEINEELIRHYIDTEDMNMLSRHIDVLKDADIPRYYLKSTIDRVLGPLGDEIRRSVQHVTKTCENEIKKSNDKNTLIWGCRAIRKTLDLRLKRILEIIKTVDAEFISDSALACEEYSLFLRVQLAIPLYQAKAYSEAKKVMAEALQFAVITNTRNKIKGEIEILSQSVLQEEIDEFLREDDVEPKAESVDHIRISEEETEPSKVEEDSEKKTKEERATDPYGISANCSEVTVMGSQFSIPSRCNCCLGQPDAEDQTSHEYEDGNIKHTISLGIPVCNICLKHRGSLKKKLFFMCASITAGSIGWIFWLTSVEPFISMDSALASTAVVILILYFLTNRLIPAHTMTKNHGGSELSVRMVRASSRGYAVFRFLNPAYARLFAASNDSKVDTRPKWKHSRTSRFPIRSKSATQVLLVSTIIVLLGFWYMWSSYLHTTLFIDNAWGQTLTLNFNNRLSLKVRPGLSTARIPVTPLSVRVSDGNNFLFMSRGNITSAGNWVYNIGRKNSYESQEVHYGSVGKKPSRRALGSPEFFKTTADYVFEDPPQNC